MKGRICSCRVDVVITWVTAAAVWLHGMCRGGNPGGDQALGIPTNCNCRLTFTCMMDDGSQGDRLVCA